jgi:GxxExxY protein
MGLLHEELTFELRRSMMEVQNELGVGFDEETYHRGLIRRLTRAGRPFVSKQRRQLMHRGSPIRTFELDFLVEDKIIVELKCLRCSFLRANYVQILSHLKIWQKDLGLLVNWGLPRLHFQRIPFSEKPKRVVEDYGHIRGALKVSERHTLEKIRNAVLFVLATHGLGFGKSVYQELVEAELQYREIHVERSKALEVYYENVLIRTFPMRFWVVENQILCDITALQDRIMSEHPMRMRTFLKHLELSTGLIINFGKHHLELMGVHF